MTKTDKIVAALKKANPKATSVVKNEFGDYDVSYFDEFVEETHTYTLYKGKLLFVGTISCEV